MVIILPQSNILHLQVHSHVRTSMNKLQPLCLTDPNVQTRDGRSIAAEPNLSHYIFPAQVEDEDEDDVAGRMNSLAIHPPAPPPPPEPDETDADRQALFERIIRERFIYGLLDVSIPVDHILGIYAIHLCCASLSLTVADNFAGHRLR